MGGVIKLLRPTEQPEAEKTLDAGDLTRAPEESLEADRGGLTGVDAISVGTDPVVSAPSETLRSSGPYGVDATATPDGNTEVASGEPGSGLTGSGSTFLGTAPVGEAPVAIGASGAVVADDPTVAPMFETSAPPQSAFPAGDAAADDGAVAPMFEMEASTPSASMAEADLTAPQFGSGDLAGAGEFETRDPLGASGDPFSGSAGAVDDAAFPEPPAGEE